MKYRQKKKITNYTVSMYFANLFGKTNFFQQLNKALYFKTYTGLPNV
jgi:hypothetical protein